MVHNYILVGFSTEQLSIFSVCSPIQIHAQNQFANCGFKYFPLSFQIKKIINPKPVAFSESVKICFKIWRI